MSKLKRYKRAVSPVVTIVFLMGIFVAAIAVSLGIIYPQVQELNDRIEIESAGSTMLSLNSEIQTLILNGIDSKIIKQIDYGQTGVFIIDQSSDLTLRLKSSGNISQTYGLDFPRLQIRQVIETDLIEEGSHGYLLGSSSQSTFFLNSITRRNIDWPILNQSRPVSSDFVFTSLSYRNIVDITRTIDEDRLQVNATITIQSLEVLVPRDNSASGPDPQIELFYRGAKSNSTNWIRFNNDVSLEATTLLSNPNAVSFVETPVYIEAPVEATTTFSVRLQFIQHQLEILI